MSSYREAIEREATQRQAGQPLPTPGAQSVFAEVRRLLDAREAKGVATYGRTLETFNGRDAHQDGLEELLDGFLYRTQAQMERQALEERLVQARAELKGARAALYGLLALPLGAFDGCMRLSVTPEAYRAAVDVLGFEPTPPPQGPRHDIAQLIAPPLKRETATFVLRCRDCHVELDPLTARAFFCPACQAKVDR